MPNLLFVLSSHQRNDGQNQVQHYARHQMMAPQSDFFGGFSSYFSGFPSHRLVLNKDSTPFSSFVLFSV